MQTVKIPDDVRPVWSCSINGKDYEYPAGATVSVPDEVAALIANINASKPQQAVKEPTQQIKRPTAAGKVLVSNDKLEWEEGDDPTGQPVVTVQGTFGPDANKRTTMSLNIKATDLYDVCKSGYAVLVAFHIEQSLFDQVILLRPHISAVRDSVGSQGEYNSVYSFRFITADGDVYAAENILEIDTGDVVLTKEEGVGGTFFVPFTVTEGSVSTTAKFSDVKAAVTAGKNVIAAVNIDSNTILYAPLQIAMSNTLLFSTVADMGGDGNPEPQLMKLLFAADGCLLDAVDLAVAT